MLHRLAVILAVALVACSAADRSPDPTTAASAVRSLAASDSTPAAPTNVSIVVDSSAGKFAYFTATWTDNTNGRAQTQVYVPDAYSFVSTAGATSLTGKVKKGEFDFFVRSSIFENNIPGISIFSEPVGPIHLDARH